MSFYSEVCRDLSAFYNVFLVCHLQLFACIPYRVPGPGPEPVDVLFQWLNLRLLGSMLVGEGEASDGTKSLPHSLRKFDDGEQR